MDYGEHSTTYSETDRASRIGLSEVSHTSEALRFYPQEQLLSPVQLSPRQPHHRDNTVKMASTYHFLANSLPCLLTV